MLRKCLNFIMKAAYQTFIELTIIIHLLFILFVIASGFIANKNRWVRIIHLSSLVWAVFAELSPGVICPLTKLENYFAFHAGIAIYQQDFVSRSLVPVIYQENVSVNIQYVLVAVVIFINVIAYRKYLSGGNVR